MPSPLDPQIVALAAALGLLVLLVGFGIGRWSARRRLAAAVDDWQLRVTQAEGTRGEAEAEAQRLAEQVSEIQVAAEAARDRAAGTETEAEVTARRLAEEEQRTAAMAEELQALKNRNAELREEIETWRDEVAHQQREQLTAEENIDRLASDLTASRDRAAAVEAEVARLRSAALAAERGRAESAEEAAVLRDEVTRLRQVKLDFQRWIQGAAGVEEDLADARSRLADAGRERDTLRDEIEHRDRRIAELEAEAEARRQAAVPPPPQRPTGEAPELLQAPQGPADDLERIRGIGPVLERTLNQLGIYHFRQIARWTRPEIEWIASHIDTFPDRIERDRWVEQATNLDREPRRGGF